MSFCSWRLVASSLVEFEVRTLGPIQRALHLPTKLSMDVVEIMRRHQNRFHFLLCRPYAISLRTFLQDTFVWLL
jgi:hypothetical protein